MDEAGTAEQDVEGPPVGERNVGASVTSSRRVATKASARSATLSSAMSVARTLAPSAAKASAVARPIPCAAAVTKARLPSSRPAMPPLRVVAPITPTGKMPRRRSLCKSPPGCCPAA